jgi:hypothetical protein
MRYAKTDHGLIGKKDITINVKNIIKMLNDSHIIPKYKTIDEIIEVIENYHDPEFTYTNL